MSDLITRLSAELDRRQAMAVNATDSPWEVVAMRDHTYGIWAEGAGFSGEDDHLASANVEPDAAHIAANDPAAVLRLIEAHRKIVARYVKVDAELHAHAARVHAGEHIDGEARVRSEAHMWQHMALYEVVRHLARGYGLTTEEGTST